MAGRAGISAAAVALAGAAAVTVYAGVKGVSAGSGLRAILSGHQLPPGQDLVTVQSVGAAASGTLAAPSSPLSGVNSPIAATAQRYVGTGAVYRWAGGNPHGWDCSGFVNWVLCHDLGMAIPGFRGGTFTGRAHGPTTAIWAIWPGVQRIGRADLAAGDLAIWPAQHMAIALSNDRMVGAPGPNGTPAPVDSGIPDRISGFPLVCYRLRGR
jgi:cell wall-associated NlpC family hydrolase